MRPGDLRDVGGDATRLRGGKRAGEGEGGEGEGGEDRDGENSMEFGHGYFQRFVL